MRVRASCKSPRVISARGQTFKWIEDPLPINRLIIFEQSAKQIKLSKLTQAAVARRPRGQAKPIIIIDFTLSESSGLTGASEAAARPSEALTRASEEAQSQRSKVRPSLRGLVWPSEGSPQPPKPWLERPRLPARGSSGALHGSSSDFHSRAGGELISVSGGKQIGSPLNDMNESDRDSRSVVSQIWPARDGRESES